MPVSWSVPLPERVLAPDVDPKVLGGEDIRLRGSHGVDVGPHGDLATVKGVDAAYQSVVRESTANPASLVRRPQWGVGLPGMLFQNNSKANRDQALARQRARLDANPRISSTQEVRVDDLEDGDGFQLVVRATSVDGGLVVEAAVTPKGVQ